MITGVIHLVTDKREGVSSEGFEGARMGEGGILAVVGEGARMVEGGILAVVREGTRMGEGGILAVVREGARMGEGGIMAVVRGRRQGIYVNLRKPGCSIISVMCLLQ